MDELSKEWKEATDGLKKALVETEPIGTIYKVILQCMEKMERILEKVGGRRK